MRRPASRMCTSPTPSRACWQRGSISSTPAPSASSRARPSSDGSSGRVRSAASSNGDASTLDETLARAPRPRAGAGPARLGDRRRGGAHLQAHPHARRGLREPPPPRARDGACQRRRLDRDDGRGAVGRVRRAPRLPLRHGRHRHARGGRRARPGAQDVGAPLAPARLRGRALAPRDEEGRAPRRGSTRPWPPTISNVPTPWRRSPRPSSWTTRGTRRTGTSAKRPSCGRAPIRRTPRAWRTSRRGHARCPSAGPARCRASSRRSPR